MSNYKTNIINGRQATLGMMTGISVVTDLIRPTYGGSGTNVVVEDLRSPGHQIANDAQTIVQAIELEDPAEKRGLGFIKELCNRADKMSGDARKTTIILAEEILKAGYKSDMNKIQLKRELDALIPVIEAAIEAQTKQITVKNVASVAATASENPETGKLIQEIYKKIGANGIIQPEASGTFETYYRFIDGVRFDMTGMLSPEMVHDEQAVKDKFKETRAVYEKPLILVTKKKITIDDDINPLLWELKNTGEKNLVIFTNDMDSGVASMLVGLHKSKTFNILILRAPTLWQNYVFEDFAKCVGATIVEDATGKTFKNLQVSDLGTCDKIIADEEETLLFGTQDISQHVKKLEKKGDEDSLLRLSWLANKSVILRLGANSETDLSYKRLKTNDAIRSSQLALKYGIVVGGGVCLDVVSSVMPDTEAGRIMKQALQAPRKQIIANGCETYPDPDKVVDSTKVVANAVRNAVGIASTILTANGLVYLVEQTGQVARPEYAF